MYLLIVLLLLSFFYSTSIAFTFTCFPREIMNSLSPHSMARAAYEDAVALMNSGPSCGGGGGGDGQGHRGSNNEMTDRDKNNGNEAERSNDSVLFGVTNKHNYVDNGHGEKVLVSRIEDIWSSDNGTTVDTKISATMETIFKEIDGLVNSGLRAYNELESTTRQLNQSKELAETRSREVKRLHDQDEQSRSTLAVRNVHCVIAFP
jgi:hypothetical protein